VFNVEDAAMVNEVEIEPSKQPVTAPSEAERETAAQLLHDAVASGRLTLDEFSDRVGSVWAVESHDGIAVAVSGLASGPVDAATTLKIIAFVGDQRRVGRWRLPRRLRLLAVLGDVYLDLCAVVCSDENVQIRAWVFLGDIHVQVPDGVEVELAGVDVLGGRELRLAPVPRLAGTPKVLITVYSLLGGVAVWSVGAGRRIPRWRRWLFSRESSPGLSGSGDGLDRRGPAG
jgi:hypothetical protein